MSRFRICDEDFIELDEIVKRIRYCLRNQVGFSLVRVGDAENQVMAQGIIIPESDINEIWWANDEKWTGVILPNYEARDRLLESVKKADVVGVLNQDTHYIWKPLSEDIFSCCNIKPRQICYAFINTYFAQSAEFIKLMQNYRVLLAGNPASQFAAQLKSKYDIDAAGVVAINNYHEIPRVIDEINQIDFDMAIISAGSNAVILSVILAEQGKVALDFGRGMNAEYW